MSVHNINLSALVEGHHGILGLVASHLVELGVYLVKVAQVQNNLLRLRLEVVRELLVPDLSRCQKVSHEALKGDQSHPEGSKRASS